MPRYIEHITLTTGHRRRSWRHEIDPALMGRLRDLVQSAREESGALLPGTTPPLWLSIEDTARCALCSVRTEDDVAVVTFAVANHSRCGSQLWTLLRETATYPPVVSTEQDRPDTPWCAVRLDAGISLLTNETLAALGDLERCVAWAWLER